MYNQETDYNSFKKQLPELLRSHSGKFVVFHKGDLDSSFEARTDALQYARNKFGLGNYIVQEVRPINPKPASYSLLARSEAV